MWTLIRHTPFFMTFDYNTKKNLANIHDYGISLDFTSKVFFDPNRCEIFDRNHSTYDPAYPDCSEDRYITIGYVSEIPVYVVYTVVGPDNYHLISAREATKSEVRQYYQQGKQYLRNA